jgi:hypothetical protein
MSRWTDGGHKSFARSPRPTFDLRVMSSKTADLAWLRKQRKSFTSIEQDAEILRVAVSRDITREQIAMATSNGDRRL